MFMESTKNFNVVSDSSTIEFIENLHKYECVENDGSRDDSFIFVTRKAKKGGSIIKKEKVNTNLEDRLTNNHFPHLEAN